MSAAPWLWCSCHCCMSPLLPAPYHTISHAGLQVEASRFFIYWMFINLINICAVSLAFMVGAAVKTAALANLLILIPFILAAVSCSVPHALVEDDLTSCADIWWSSDCTGFPGPLGLLAGLPEFHTIWSGGIECPIYTPCSTHTSHTCTPALECCATLL